MHIDNPILEVCLELYYNDKYLRITVIGYLKAEHLKVKCSHHFLPNIVSIG